MMLMEPDSEIRDVLQKQMESLGHKTESETDGLKAWDHFHFNHKRFWSMRKMPRLTGIELLRRVREREPSLPVAMSSNIRRLERVLLEIPYDLRAVLPMPYRLHQLEQILHVLDRKRTPQDKKGLWWN